MPYDRPNPLTAAHSVVFMQSHLLHHLPAEFVQETGLDEARTALVLFLRPAVGSLEVASVLALNAMAHCFGTDMEPAEYARELCLHSMLLRQHLPKAARRDALRAVLAIAIKADELVSDDMKTYVGVGLPGLLGLDFAELSTCDDENALQPESLSYPKSLVQLALESIQQSASSPRRGRP